MLSQRPSPVPKASLRERACGQTPQCGAQRRAQGGIQRPKTPAKAGLQPTSQGGAAGVLGWPALSLWALLLDAYSAHLSDRVRASSPGKKAAEPRAPVEGASDPIRGSGDSDVALVRKAAALRTKYKRKQPLLRIPVMQIGAHPDNRDGQGPSGSRCLELTSKILSVGFDEGEADSNGVLVEVKPGSTHICSANRRFADGDELLAPIVDGQICYSSLSH